jgi:hypothetical protein
MATCQSPNCLAEAAEEFNRHEHRADGTRVAACLANGLSILQDLFYYRIYRDVRRVLGRDSSLMPASELKAQQMATEEIAAYMIAESASAAVRHGYVGEDRDWYVRWLARLRWGQLGLDAEIVKRSRTCLSKTPDGRRLAFMDRLLQIVPESRQAPLVLFRLLPLSIGIATSCAFVDRETAARLRRQQLAVLPAIADCRQCRGQVLDCVEQCRVCGNPVWKYEWLVALD